MTRAAAARKKSKSRPAAVIVRYLEESQKPLVILAFLLPFIALYEITTFFYATDHVAGTEHRLVAFTLMQRFFELCHASGRYLPALAICGALLAWHIVRKDPWTLEPMTPVAMALESLVLALPLLVLCRLAVQYIPLYAARPDPRVGLVYSLGAGVYEELIFRLFAFALLSFLFIDWLRFDRFWAMLAIVFITSILFAAYHYWGQHTIYPQFFIFRTVAGIYFATTFLLRGYGVTAGAHTFYDIITVLMASH